MFESVLNTPLFYALKILFVYLLHLHMNQLEAAELERWSGYYFIDGIIINEFI